MADKRFWTLTAGTIVGALAIGFVMQTFLHDHDALVEREDEILPGAAAPQPQTDVAKAVLTPAPATASANATPGPMIAEMGAAGAFSAVPPVPEVVTRNLTDVLIDTSDIRRPLEPKRLAQNDACKIEAVAEPAPKASVHLSVDAPCNLNDQIAVYHTGLSFTMITDGQGHAEAVVPALSQKAVFVIATPGGGGGVATLPVPDLADWNRVALQWTGPAGFQIHAREFGAAYGAPGHVWQGMPENSDTGSFLVHLGDASGLDARMVEVYSIPGAAAQRSGTVMLTVETEVTVDSCGVDVAAQVLERPAGGSLLSRDLTLTMPTCSTVGDFLVLNNLLDDLKIAAN